MYIRFAFLLSIAMYFLLVFLDVTFPGLVSNYLSAHWLLLIGLALYIVLAAKGIPIERHAGVERGIVVLFGFGATIVTWNLGRPLEEYRILFTFLSALIPYIAYRVLLVSNS
ncbi:hypothetical protein HYW18_04085 [Candidatus Uhrbacteria bacterium]|nr:hypothetical protein [Candidatus Uhrbacteria bacterium]